MDIGQYQGLVAMMGMAMIALGGFAYLATRGEKRKEKQLKDLEDKYDERGHKVNRQNDALRKLDTVNNLRDPSTYEPIPPTPADWVKYGTKALDMWK